MIPETPPVKNHYGNNQATVFDFPFYIEDGSQLRVVHTDFDGQNTILIEGVDYTIDEIGDYEGSFITFPIEGSAFETLAWNESSGERELLTLFLNLKFSQESEFGMSENLDLEQLENAFDYHMRCLQILARQLERSIKVPEGSNLTPDQLRDNLLTAEKNTHQYMITAEALALDARNSATTAKACEEEVKETYDIAMSDIENNYNAAINEINNLHQSTIIDIAQSRDTAVNVVETCEQESTARITEFKNTVLEEVNESQTEALDNITQSKDSAVNFIETTSQAAQDEVSVLKTDITTMTNDARDAIHEAEKAAIGNILGETSYIIYRNWKE